MNDCAAGEACVEDESDMNLRCTTSVPHGAACDPTLDNCIGSCLDIELEEDDNGTPTNTYCSDWCASNADCPVNTVCNWLLLSKNDPTTHADDIHIGFCHPMGVRSGAGCTVPGDCANGDACDTTTGRCYTTSATWGAACAEHSDCPQYGLCAKGVSGGWCYRPTLCANVVPGVGKWSWVLETPLS